MAGFKGFLESSSDTDVMVLELEVSPEDEARLETLSAESREYGADEGLLEVGEPDEGKDSDWFLARLTGGANVTLPVMDFGLRLGVSFFGDILEVGVEGAVMPLIVLMYGYGAYAQVAPVPTKIGKRFYVVGRFRRMFVSEDSAGVEYMQHVTLGLGYRQKMDDRDPGSPWWYVELALGKHTKKYREGYCDENGECDREEKLFPQVTAGMRF